MFDTPFAAAERLAGAHPHDVERVLEALVLFARPQRRRFWRDVATLMRLQSASDEA